MNELLNNDELLQQVQDFAQQQELTIDYVMSEFVIDGELLQSVTTP